MMFNRTFILPRTETRYVTREVHEHRAPTDESVKLLCEMEAAADAKRIASMQMPGNLFHGVVEVMETNHDMMRHAKAVFDINGKRLTAGVSGDSFGEPERLFMDLHSKVAAKIATEILIEMTRGLRLDRWSR